MAQVIAWMAVQRVVASRRSWTGEVPGSSVFGWADGTFPEADSQPAPATWYGWVLGAGAYALLVLFTLRSVALAPAGSWIGGGEIEGWLWRYWWMKQVVAGAFAGAGPLYGIHTFLVAGSYPEFGNLLDLQVFSWPLELALGAPAHHNAKVFLLLWLDCLAFWWFLSSLWGRSAAAWLGGLVYGLNPYFLFEIANGRLRQAVAFTIPLFLLYLYRSWRQGDRRSTVLAGAWLGLTAAFYLYYGLFLGLFGCLFLAWHGLVGRRLPHAPGLLPRLLATVGVGFLVAAPFALFYLQGALGLGSENLEVAPYGTAFPALESVSAPQGTARPENLLAGSQKRFLEESLPLDALWNPSLYHALPLIPLLLALVPWGGSRRAPWLWGATFLGFLVLSFGPYLSLGVHSRVYLSEVPMPYLSFYRWLPFFSRLFSPARLEVMVYAALAILVTLRVREIAGWRRGAAWAAVVLATLGTMVQLELAGVVPLPTVQLGVAPYYYLLAEQPPTGLIEVPFQTGDYLEYNQTVHDQKVLWSFAERGVPPGYPPGHQAWLAREQGVEGNSFVTWLAALNRDPLRPRDFQKADLEALVRSGYRLLVLHERGCYYLDPQGGERLYFRLLAHFRKVLGEPAAYTDEPVYRGLQGRWPAEEQDPAWYRVAVFYLGKREGPTTVGRNQAGP